MFLAEIHGPKSPLELLIDLGIALVLYVAFNLWVKQTGKAKANQRRDPKR